MNYRKVSVDNNVFLTVIFLCTAFLTGFIILTVSTILMKGLPNLWGSLLTREIQFAIGLSLATSTISTILCVFFAVPVAYSMARFYFWGKSLVNVVLNVPIALPPIVSGIALLMLFGATSWGEFLANLGIRFVFTWQGIILAQFFVNVSYTIKILKATIEEIDPHMEFVARTLGCNHFQSFFKVTLPLFRNGLVTATAITWTRALGAFGAILMLAGATRLQTEILPVTIFLNMAVGSLEVALAAATILVIISLAVLFLFEFLGDSKRQFRKGF